MDRIKNYDRFMRDDHKFDENLYKKVIAVEPVVSWQDNNLRIEIPSEGITDENEDIAYADGDIKETKDGEKFFYAGNFYVHPQVRRHGVGEKLILKTVEELKNIGVRKIFGISRGGSMLKILARVFGEDNLVFYNNDEEPSGKTLRKSYKSAVYHTYVSVGVDISVLDEKVKDNNKRLISLPHKKYHR
jgi:GNAT superfamily N-acetyltransferase